MNLSIPLVVPSFSSRGFPQQGRDLTKVTRNHFREFAIHFKKALLISAFDLHFDYIDKNDIPGGSTVFVDSGGYEIGEEDDDAAIYPKRPLRAFEKWSEELYVSTIWNLPDESRFFYINYDLKADLKTQIANATAQLSKFTLAGRSFLLKEEPIRVNGKIIPGSAVPFAETLAKIPEFTEELKAFHIFGITEKGLGSTSYFERIRNLKILCDLLKKLNLNIPVHVFGALDPLSARVYSMAGADIYDGLTWIRFAYRGDDCVYLYNEILNEPDLEMDFTEGQNAIYNKNYLELSKLQNELQEYRLNNDPAVLKLNDAMKSRILKALEKIKKSDLYKNLIG